jgi:hypothetical protein
MMSLSVGNAIWLFKALPDWFFGIPHSLQSALDPFTAICIIGETALVIGLMLMVWHRRWALLIFIFPVVVCHILVAAAGFMRGQASDEATRIILLAILAFQLSSIGYLIYLARGTRLAATCLGVFCVAYTLMASFIAAMAFTDSWV